VREYQKPIIFFDGYCNLCSASVQFILKRDKLKLFLFSSLQSDAAKELLLQYQTKNNLVNSVLFLDQNKVYEKSDAVLRIIKHLGFPYKYFTILSFLPKILRDNLYDFVAKNRFRWFGKKESCSMSQENFEERFIA
jgi:predicted DCC family thiol-disulfide oxidoreductase YuxK